MLNYKFIITYKNNIPFSCYVHDLKRKSTGATYFVTQQVNGKFILYFNFSDTIFQLWRNNEYYSKYFYRFLFLNIYNDFKV